MRWSTSCCSRAAWTREDLARHRDPTIRDFLPDPSCFRDMDKARSGSPTRSRAARQSRSSAITTSTARPARRLLILLLRRLGAEPMVYIPDRLMEGYGPSGKALVELKARGASVAVCVDCGAQAFDALRARPRRRARRDRRRPSPVREPAPGRARDDQSQPARRERRWCGPRPSRRGRDGVPARRRVGPRAARRAASSRRSPSRRSSTCSTWSRSAPSPTSPD